MSTKTKSEKTDINHIIVEPNLFYKSLISSYMIRFKIKKIKSKSVPHNFFYLLIIYGYHQYQKEIIYLIKNILVWGSPKDLIKLINLSRKVDQEQVLQLLHNVLAHELKIDILNYKMGNDKNSGLLNLISTERSDDNKKTYLVKTISSLIYPNINSISARKKFRLIKNKILNKKGNNIRRLISMKDMTNLKLYNVPDKIIIKYTSHLLKYPSVVNNLSDRLTKIWESKDCELIVRYLINRSNGITPINPKELFIIENSWKKKSLDQIKNIEKVIGQKLIDVSENDSKDSPSIFIFSFTKKISRRYIFKFIHCVLLLVSNKSICYLNLEKPLHLNKFLDEIKEFNFKCSYLFSELCEHSNKIDLDIFISTIEKFEEAKVNIMTTELLTDQQRIEIASKNYDVTEWNLCSRKSIVAKNTRKKVSGKSKSDSTKQDSTKLDSTKQDSTKLDITKRKSDYIKNKTKKYNKLEKYMKDDFFKVFKKQSLIKNE